MAPELLARIGRSLYGETWQTSLATALGINRRTVNRWLSGYSRIPARITRDLIDLAETREAELIGLVGEMVRS